MKTPLIRLILLATFLSNCAQKTELKRYPLSPSEVLSQSTDSEWRKVNQEDLIYMQLPHGLVVFELVPWFAPEHVDNIKNIVLSRFWDGLPIMRSQDNYVVQWGDQDKVRKNYFKRKKWNVKKTMTKKEFEMRFPQRGDFHTPLEKDVYAHKVGFYHEMPVGHDRKKENMWLLHCYGMVGVSRDVDPLSGNGESLYVVTGHSPRHLDRNITLVGRVLKGMEHLSSLPRGKGTLGFYKDKKKYTKIKSIRIGNELKKSKQIQFELMKSNSQSFKKLISARKDRKEDWFYRPAGQVEICNVPIPIREKN